MGNESDITGRRERRNLVTIQKLANHMGKENRLVIGKERRNWRRERTK